MKVVHVARKPLTSSVAESVVEHGTGALNIDASRIGTEGGMKRHTSSSGSHRDRWEGNESTGEVTFHGGRWPSNVILTSPEAAEDIDAQSGVSVSSGGRAYQNTNDMYSGGWGHKGKGVAVDPGYGDVGGASRYFRQVGGSSPTE